MFDFETKTHLPKLLARVAKGERITITKHGVPVAVLQPPEDSLAADPTEVVEQLKRFRKGKRLGDLSIRDAIEKGRK